MGSLAGLMSSTGPSQPPKQTAVYVTDLPEDVTIDELHQHFSKVGVIMDDMFTGGPRIKLYEAEDGGLKGDALIVYLCEPSVKLAIEILDESQLRPGVVIRVKPASFNKSEASVAKREHPVGQEPEAKNHKVDKETWKRQMREMKKKIAWDADEEEGVVADQEEASARAKQSQWDRVVVLRHMFTRKELEEDPAAILDIKQDIMEEAERFGPVASVYLFEQSEDGRCAVKFKSPEAAQPCIAAFEGRYFSGRRIGASLYDGSFRLRETKNRAAEALAEEERLNRFTEWLENDGSTDEED